MFHSVSFNFPFLHDFAENFCLSNGEQGLLHWILKILVRGLFFYQVLLLVRFKVLADLTSQNLYYNGCNKMFHVRSMYPHEKLPSKSYPLSFVEARPRA